MQIKPGSGVELLSIGDTRAAVESRLGAASSVGSRYAYDTAPPLFATYAVDGTVELIEVGHSGGNSRHEAFLGDVQLTYRFMDEVVADLARDGHVASPIDIGFAFAAGFAIFSMSSLAPGDLDPNAGPDDERAVVEGVAVAPFGYF